jgi:amino acid adenylation domain-containing protein
MTEQYKSKEQPNAEKIAQFEEFLKKKGIEDRRSLAITRQNSSGPFELSFGQQRIYFLEQFEKGSSSNVIPTAVNITGHLNMDVLLRCFNEIIRRHESLRTTFHMAEDKPVQVVAPVEEATVYIDTINLMKIPEPLRQAEVHKLLSEQSQKPFDLSKGPLLRLLLVQLSKYEHVLLMTMHHIISDNWSIGVLIREMTELYDAFCHGKPPHLPQLQIQYTDYASWQRQWLKGKILKDRLEFWKKNLEGAAPLLGIPSDKPRPAVQSNRGSLKAFTLPGNILQSLKAFGHEEGASLFMVLLAAFKVLLYKYSGQEDIVIGTPVAGRGNIETENLIGLFINTIALRTSFAGDMPFRQMLRKVRQSVLEALNHQDLPFEKVVEELNPERNISYNPIFQAMFVMQNAPMPTLNLTDLSLSVIPVDSGFAQFDLSMTVWEEDDILKGTLEYSTDLFYSKTIDRMLGHFVTLIKGITENPDQQLCRLPILTPDESRQILVEWNQTEQKYNNNIRIHELFEKQAEKTPDAIAVSYNGKCLTYKELNKQADILAGALKKIGIGPEKLVGIYIEHSLELMAAVLGVLKAGAGYVPLDSEYPQDRLQYMIEDSGMTALLTQRKLISLIPRYNLPIICADREIEAAGDGSSIDIKAGRTCGNIAGVIYTSGSTGKPKGVFLEHRGIVNLITSFIRSYNIIEQDSILPITSLGSSSFVGEIFPLICAGGRVVLVPKNDLLDYDKFVSAIANNDVTIISSVPSFITRFNSEKIIPPKLRLILCGGEALAPGDVNHLINCATVVNGYGVTEATICSTYHIVTEEDLQRDSFIPIGKPIMNNKIYILDKNLNCVPIGITGEMYICGDGVTRGYLNNEKLTNEKFIPCPFSKGEVMYKTGDLACWRSDGVIRYISRMDNQVKIRGFRIELGEVEVRIKKHESVSDAVVIIREDIPGDKRMIAYIVPCAGKKITSGEMSNWLRNSLPEYMIPHSFEIHDSLPLNPNGKVNINALPMPRAIHDGRDKLYNAPKTRAEVVIGKVWSEFLKNDKIGIYDNFFDIGGHSLLIMQIHSKLKGMFKKELNIIDMFKYPTISSLAGYLSQEQEEQPGYAHIYDRARMQREAFSRSQERHAKRI